MASVLARLDGATSADDAAPLPLGVIGCGGYGRTNINNAFKAGGVELVGLCDVDSAHLEETAAMVEKLGGRRPKTFKLYEEMLAMPELQAVVIASPPHWHALHFLAALERGLDIYCEKPLSYDVREGQAMAAAAAAKPERIVQIGFQRRQAAAIGRRVTISKAAAPAGSFKWKRRSITGQGSPTPHPRIRPRHWIGSCGADPLPSSRIRRRLGM
jgi:hypothetical protein